MVSTELISIISPLHLFKVCFVLKVDFRIHVDHSWAFHVDVEHIRNSDDPADRRCSY